MVKTVVIWEAEAEVNGLWAMQHSSDGDDDRPRLPFLWFIGLNGFWRHHVSILMPR
jgi:hypothetical protein